MWYFLYISVVGEDYEIISKKENFVKCTNLIDGKSNLIKT